MDGEFVCEDVFGTVKGVGGGNFLILAASQTEGLAAAEAAVAAIRKVPGVILPFPGGIVRSGSKIGSKYKKLKASTNDAYCPTLRGLVKSALPDGVNAVYEIVIDGIDQTAVEEATRVGVRAACMPGVLGITAGNYGGNLGPVHLYLHKLLAVSEFNPHCRAAMSAIVRPMLSEAVAAGEGAFKTWIMCSACTKRKSSTMAPLGSMRLAAYAAAEGMNVGHLQFRHQPFQSVVERALAEGAIHLAEAGAPVFARHAPEAGVAQQLPHVARREVPAAVAFAAKRQHRVRAGLDLRRPRVRVKWTPRNGKRGSGTG